MTRRLEPQERIAELGDASVPFPFDVHAMLYSDDAPELECALHAFCDDKHINLVNLRKEFFATTLEDIEQFAQQRGIPIHLTKIAEAREYRETMATRAARAAQPAAAAVAFPASIFEGTPQRAEDRAQRNGGRGNDARRQH